MALSLLLLLFLFLFTVPELLHHVEGYRNEEDGDYSRCTHAADDRRAHDLPRDSTSPARYSQRHAAQDKGKARHENRAKAQPGSVQCRIRKALTLFVFHLGKLDNKDR